VPENCNTVLNLGYGTGKLTRKLTLYAKEIIGIDVSEKMKR
jgi:predicted TPR repeat methyltransferase